MKILLLSSIGVPLLCGAILLLVKRKQENSKIVNLLFMGMLLLSCVLPAMMLGMYEDGSVLIFSLMQGVPIEMGMDALTRPFVWITIGLWLLVGIFATDYLKKDPRKSQFYGVYLLLLAVMLGLYFSTNLMTLYAFYEFMTLLALPLIVFTQKNVSIMAGMKYLFYSLAGAYMGLFGMYVLYSVAGGDLLFAPGGKELIQAAAGQDGRVLLATFLMITGFGVKAGMIPFHGWLPAAHPVAPSPASAILSALLVKGGVFAILRTIFYIVGAEILRGTWVQYAFMTMSLVTVFVGSMLAYKEPVLKKRLAYSTVSQVSYILFGISLLHPVAFTGAILHTIFHAIMKTSLFLFAGAMIHKYEYENVHDYIGIGKREPFLLGCYGVAALGMVGIPPFSGFISKWWLAIGSLQSGMSVYDWVGVVVLLLSALLTAGYLFPLIFQGIFQTPAFPKEGRKPNTIQVVIPMAILALLTIGLGIFANPLIHNLAVITKELW